MPDEAVTYPADASASTYLLTVHGKVSAPTAADARQLHNATAGAPQGVAAARSLGDLSHNVYTSFGEPTGEILFIDYWNSLTGFGQFFSDPQVQAGAGQLFTEREAVIWAPASGFGDFHLAIPSGSTLGGVGLLRAGITSLETAAPGFSAYASATINTARRYGLAAHSTWSRVTNPGDTVPPEVLSIDIWTDAQQMAEYYELGLGFEHLGPVFAGQPQTSQWQPAPGAWTEW
ncbi:MAG TPA: hypothetical protein VF070_07060 [Streptosporangiaceae bacterium]